MEPGSRRLTTEYERIAHARQSAPAAPEWRFTGAPWTDSECNRTRELAHGCGISPGVWGDSDARIGETPVTARASLRFGTTALAAMGGITPRGRGAETTPQRRKEKVVWHQIDLQRSGQKESRPFAVAGQPSARLAELRRRPVEKMEPGRQERPDWMREEQNKPGKWGYSPTGTQGQPSVFGREAHFTESFPTPKRKW